MAVLPKCLCGVFLFIYICNLPTYSQNNYNSTPAKLQSTNQNNLPVNSPYVNSTVRQPESRRGALNPPHNEQTTEWEKWSAIGTLLSAGVSVLLFIGLLVQNFYLGKSLTQVKRQAKTMEDQVTEMKNQAGTMQSQLTTMDNTLEYTKDSSYTVQRAYLGIVGILTKPIKPGQPFEINIRVKNGGQTPAWLVRADFHIWIQKDLPPLPEFASLRPTGMFVPSQGATTFIFSWVEPPLTNENIAAIKNNELRVFISGKFFYTNIRESTASEIFDYIYRPQSSDFAHLDRELYTKTQGVYY